MIFQRGRSTTNQIDIYIYILVFSECVCKDVGFGDKRPTMSIAAQAFKGILVPWACHFGLSLWLVR